MNKPLVIIPTYDERENVEAIAQAVLDRLPEGEVLFVDDNSPDGTGAMLDGMARGNPRIHVLHREGKQGLGRAYIARKAIWPNWVPPPEMLERRPELPRFMAGA